MLTHRVYPFSPQAQGAGGFGSSLHQSGRALGVVLALGGLGGLLWLIFAGRLRGGAGVSVQVGRDPKGRFARAGAD